MQKISSPGATSTNEFTEGNPSSGQPATVVSAAWTNSVQRELVALVQAAGLTLNANDDTQILQAIQILGGGSGGGSSRNLLLNGNFELAQRMLVVGSFALTNAGAYTLDRWHGRADQLGSGSGAATVTRQAFAVGQVDVPGNPKNYLRWLQTSASTANNPALAQRVEDVTLFADGSLTFSVYLKGSAALACTLRMTQVFGTSGSPSASVLIATQGVSLSTGWQRFSLSVNLATAGFNLTGKTLGTDNNSHLLVDILLPNGSSGWTIEVANAQLERNAQASTFVAREPGEELRRCQRYYQRSGSLAQAQDQTSPVLGAFYDMAANSGNNGILPFARNFVVPMRAVPTVRWRNPVDGVIDTVSWGTSKAVTSVASRSEWNTGFPLVAAGPTVGTPTLAQAHFEADAEL